MSKKSLISGCSYSCGAYSYGDLLRDTYNIQATNISRSGASNHTIIKTLYDYIIEHDFRNGKIICQLTYLHRVGSYHDIFNKIVDYQPSFVNLKPKLDENKNVIFTVNPFNSKFNHEHVGRNNDKVQRILNEMYLTYLTYVFNEEEAFKDLLYRIDTFKAFAETFGNEVLFVYWPQTKENEKNELIKRNFFNVNGEYSMLDWSVKDYQLNEFDSHLSKSGHAKLSNLLFNHFFSQKGLI